jgi:hypothetical protein
MERGLGVAVTMHEGAHAWTHNGHCALASCDARRCKKGRKRCQNPRAPGQPRCRACGPGWFNWRTRLGLVLEAAWTRPSPHRPYAVIVKRRRRRRVFDHFGASHPEQSILT